MIAQVHFSFRMHSIVLHQYVLLTEGVQAKFTFVCVATTVDLLFVLRQNIQICKSLFAILARFEQQLVVGA